MAFQARDLHVLAYANGFTLWHYTTVDAATVVDTAGYFDAAAKMLRVGDIVIANVDTDGTPGAGLFLIKSTDEGRVAFVDMTKTNPLDQQTDQSVASHETGNLSQNAPCVSQDADGQPAQGEVTVPYDPTNAMLDCGQEWAEVPQWALRRTWQAMCDAYGATPTDRPAQGDDHLAPEMKALKEAGWFDPQGPNEEFGGGERDRESDLPAYQPEQGEADDQPTDPTPGELADPLFEAIWQAIKGWDVSAEWHGGYCFSTGTHVAVILRTIRNLEPGDE